MVIVRAYLCPVVTTVRLGCPPGGVFVLDEAAMRDFILQLIAEVGAT